jgi:hypothetical protein
MKGKKIIYQFFPRNVIVKTPQNLQDLFIVPKSKENQEIPKPKKKQEAQKKEKKAEIVEKKVEKVEKINEEKEEEIELPSNMFEISF